MRRFESDPRLQPESSISDAVVLIHHSPKGQGDRMTLETALRGSGDVGAFLASCWGTKLQDPDRPFESASFLSTSKCAILNPKTLR